MAGAPKGVIVLRFTEEILSSVESSLLKSMSRTWGGKGNERKDPCLRRILAGLADPRAVRAMLDSRLPEERAALALLRNYGGLMRAGPLELTLRAHGYKLGPEPKPRYHYGHGVKSEYAESLVRRGLVLPVGLQQAYRAYGGMELLQESRVYTDARVLAQVDWPLVIHPLSVPAADPPAVTTFRRPQHVMLDLLAVMRALAEGNGIGLTQSGTMRAAEVRQFLKRVGWKQDQTFDGQLFPSVGHAFLQAWYDLGMLREEAGGLRPGREAEFFAEIPFHEQVTIALYGFRELRDWCELGEEQTPRWGDDSGTCSLRAAIWGALQALEDADTFHDLEAFVTALYSRIGDAASSHQGDGPAKPVLGYRGDARQHQLEMQAWQVQQRAHWIKRETAFTRAALTSWLYWAGVVEIGESRRGRLAFRLTPFGLQVARGLCEAAAEPAHPSAWIVQPNYDVVVYLDRVSAAQLTFLEVHAERRQAELHTAHYQLTRASIHRGVESGSTLEHILETLQQGAGADLPQNVAREIAEWTRQSDLLVLHTHARLVAFPSTDDRARAVRNGLSGREVGETYLLVESREAAGLASASRVDYARPPQPCLRVEEDGTLNLAAATNDLLLRGQLARGADPVDETRWKLTKTSLSRVHAAGVTAAAFLSFLEARALTGIPPLVECAVRGALGARLSAQSGAVLAVRISDKALYSALVGSALVQPYLLDVPGPDTLLIAAEHQEAFASLLERMSVKLAPLARPESRPDWQQTVRDAKQHHRRRWGY